MEDNKGSHQTLHQTLHQSAQAGKIIKLSKTLMQKPSYDARAFIVPENDHRPEQK
jgi:hypothetical protein